MRLLHTCESYLKSKLE